MSEQNHKWVKGDDWQRETGYYTREDTCSLCGCKRCMVKYSNSGRYQQYVAAYSRSEQVFGSDHMPECWGSKNPE